MVERLVRNEKVAGSIPVGSTIPAAQDVKFPQPIATARIPSAFNQGCNETRKNRWLAVAGCGSTNVVVSPVAAVLPVGASRLLTATLDDFAGDSLTAREVTWSTSND